MVLKVRWCAAYATEAGPKAPLAQADKDSVAMQAESVFRILSSRLGLLVEYGTSGIGSRTHQAGPAHKMCPLGQACVLESVQ